MLLLSILCLAYRLILYVGIGLDNSTPFVQKTEFRYWDPIWCFDIQILANNLESIGECESRFWAALLAHEWEELLLGSLSAWSRTAAASCSRSGHSGTGTEEPSPPRRSSRRLLLWVRVLVSWSGWIAVVRTTRTSDWAFLKYENKAGFVHFWAHSYVLYIVCTDFSLVL